MTTACTSQQRKYVSSPSGYEGAQMITLCRSAPFHSAFNCGGPSLQILSHVSYFAEVFPISPVATVPCHPAISNSCLQKLQNTSPRDREQGGHLRNLRQRRESTGSSLPTTRRQAPWPLLVIPEMSIDENLTQPLRKRPPAGRLRATKWTSSSPATRREASSLAQPPVVAATTTRARPRLHCFGHAHRGWRPQGEHDRRGRGGKHRRFIPRLLSRPADAGAV
ncbi:hypothetical protein LY76DRAFT_346141 [Colletotrichum caudatum]|nr:hypothetical protein LY76DRAFT_346141 [Colletotrichum caudatum]